MTPEKPVTRMWQNKEAPDRERAYNDQLEVYFDRSIGTNVEKLRNFTKYVPRQYLTYFLTRYEMFKQVLQVQGSVVECGVYFGGGVMTFAQLSAILEPVNHQRKIIGFDTFEGFPGVHDVDRAGKSPYAHESGLAVDSMDDLFEAIRLFDANRHVGHIPKVELVRGDARESIPEYLENHPFTVVSLLYLDIDLYEPTKAALEHFLPRIPKGGIIAFDQLNDATWQGETLAAMEVVGISNLRLVRSPFESAICYAVME